MEDLESAFGELRSACQMEPSVWAWLRIYAAIRAFHGHQGLLVDQVLPYVGSRVRSWPTEILRTTPAYNYDEHSTGQSGRLQQDDPCHELSYGDSFHVTQSALEGNNPWRDLYNKPSFQNMRHLTLRGAITQPDAVVSAIVGAAHGAKIESLAVVGGGLHANSVQSRIRREMSSLGDTSSTCLTSLVSSASLAYHLFTSDLIERLQQLTRVGFTDRHLDVIKATHVLQNVRELKHLDLSSVTETAWGSVERARVAGRLLATCRGAEHLSVSAGAFNAYHPNDFGTDLFRQVRETEVTELTVKYHTGGYVKEDLWTSMLDMIGSSKFTRLNLVEAPLGPIPTWSGLYFQGMAFGFKAPWFHRNPLEVWYPKLAKAETLSHLDLSGLGAHAVCTSKLPRPSQAFTQFHDYNKGIVYMLQQHLGDRGGFPNLKVLTLDARLKRSVDMWSGIVNACAEHGVTVVAKWHNPFEL